MSAAPNIVAAFRDVTKALAEHGVPLPSPYWFAEYERFWLHPTANTLVECAGRGADKSRGSVLSSIAEVLAGDFKIPPGERHYFTHVSENREEAAKTLGILEQYLRLLGVPFTTKGDTIELTDLPLGWKVLAGRVGAVSGWRCIGWTADECAKWSNEGADPSAEVIASIRAMTITHPNARGRMVSSPLGAAGHFYSTWALGDTDTQLSGHAATWIANPSVTEEQTRALEPDERVWKREYAAIPQSGALSAFDPEDIGRAFKPRDEDGAKYGTPIVVIDVSSGRKDGWTWGMTQWVKPTSGPSFVKFSEVDGIHGSFFRTTSGSDLVARLARFAKDKGASSVHGDQRESLMVAGEFAKNHVRYVVHDWTAKSKPRGVEVVRRWFREGVAALPEHERLRRELNLFEEHVNPAGNFTFGARGSGHDDYVALLITAALADEAGELRLPRGARREVKDDPFEPRAGDMRGPAFWGSAGRGF